MKKLAFPVIILFCFSVSAFTLDEVTYPRKSTSNSKFLDYLVPSEYPTIQTALDAAVVSGGKNIAIIVEEGEYREAVFVTGLMNLKLIGRNARILPPHDFIFTEPPVGDNFPASSLKLINCENFKVEGFTFIGNEFAEGTGFSYPMGNAILSYNSSGTISNNIIFNYFDGISFQVDNPRWLEGEICDNYIHNCLWSGIFATGSHNLKIQKNKIAFTIPRELSISVGIWTDGGLGIISENQITSYKAVDYNTKKKTIAGPDFWPSNLQSSERLDYQVINNTFKPSAAGTQFSKVGMEAEIPYRFLNKALRINNHFINVDQHNNSNKQSNMVTLRRE